MRAAHHKFKLTTLSQSILPATKYVNVQSRHKDMGWKCCGCVHRPAAHFLAKGTEKHCQSSGWRKLQPLLLHAAVMSEPSAAAP